jgi:ketosteroid isomerase-like protein
LEIIVRKDIHEIEKSLLPCFRRIRSQLESTGAHFPRERKLKMNKPLSTITAFALMALCLGSFAGLSSVANADDNDQQKITAVLRGFAAAPTPAVAFSYYAPGDDITLYEVSGEYTGQNAIREGLKKPYALFTDHKVEFVELNVGSNGNLGFGYSVQYFTAKTPDGKTVRFTRRVTTVLRKQNGQWKIIHQHMSVPVDIKTGKAEMSGF